MYWKGGNTLLRKEWSHWGACLIEDPSQHLLFCTLHEAGGGYLSNTRQEHLISLVQRMNRGGREGLVFTDPGNFIYTKVSLTLWGDVYAEWNQASPNEEKAGDVLEALLGMVVWVLNGKPLCKTLLNPEDIALMLSPRTDFFRKLSKYVIARYWLCARESVLKGNRAKTFPHVIMEDHHELNIIRNRVPRPFLPEIRIDQFILVIRDRWGIEDFEVTQPDRIWWWILAI